MIEKTELIQYSFDTSLRNGTPVHLRAIRPDDKQKILDEYHRMSDKSMYFRFLGARHELTEKEITYLTEIDFVHHVAIVATVQLDNIEEIIGVGRFVESSGNQAGHIAEVAFSVDDSYQELGVGTLLFEQLTTIAQKTGVVMFKADILKSNVNMLEIFRHSGFELKTSTEGRIEHVQFNITGQIPNRFYV